VKKGQTEQGSRQELHKEIAHAENASAITALPAQEEVTQKRNIIIPPDRVPAGKTMGTGQHNGKTRRNPVNAHIQKAPEEKSNTSHNPEVDIKKVRRKK
jgi:hypothetical protein